MAKELPCTTRRRTTTTSSVSPVRSPPLLDTRASRAKFIHRGLHLLAPFLCEVEAFVGDIHNRANVLLEFIPDISFPTRFTQVRKNLVAVLCKTRLSQGNWANTGNLRRVLEGAQFALR